jgi:hypothetical protein
VRDGSRDGSQVRPRAFAHDTPTIVAASRIPISRFNDYLDEMNEPYDMTDRDVERLFAGWRPTNDESPALGRFLRDFDRVHPQPSTSHCEAQHLTAMLGAAHLVANDGDPVVAPERNAQRPLQQKLGSQSLRRTPMFRRIASSFSLRLMIPLAAIFVVFGGVALATGLSGPAQGAQPVDTTDVTQPAVGETTTTTDGTTGVTDADDVDCTDDVNETELDDVDDTDLDDADETDDTDLDDADETELDDADDTDLDDADETELDDADDTDCTDLDDADDLPLDQAGQTNAGQNSQSRSHADGSHSGGSNGGRSDKD